MELKDRYYTVLDALPEHTFIFSESGVYIDMFTVGKITPQDSTASSSSVHRCMTSLPLKWLKRFIRILKSA